MASEAGSGPDCTIPSVLTKLGVRIDRQPVEQRFPFGPEPIAAESCNRVKLAHVKLLCVRGTIGVRQWRATRLPTRCKTGRQ
jgi:hypothetical protein